MRIRLFLGAPDSMAPNPLFRRGAPMKLFALRRIKAAEASAAWHAAQAQAHKTRQQARLRAESQAQRYVLQAQDMLLRLHALPACTLRQEALGHNGACCASGGWTGHTLDDVRQVRSPLSSSLLLKIQVSYARHVLIQYDKSVEALFARAQQSRAWITLQRRIYAKIAAVFPWLEDECARQLTLLRECEQQVVDPGCAGEIRYVYGPAFRNPPSEWSSSS